MTTPTLIRFGTDGWRAIIADTYTFENVRYCAEGVARYLKAAGLASRGLVIGYDTRFASEDFAAAVAEVIAAHGIDVWLFDRPASTPVGCYAALDKRSGGTVMITASHNPGSYNGFKYKSENGGSPPPEIVPQIEAGIDAAQLEGPPTRIPLADLLASTSAHAPAFKPGSGEGSDSAYPQDWGPGGRPSASAPSASHSPLPPVGARPEPGRREGPGVRGAVRLFDPTPAYEAHVRQTVDLTKLRDAGLHVVYDAMHSTGAGVLSRLLEGGLTRVTELRGERNPAFPGMTSPEPIARNLTQLAARVRSEGAAVGLATDGDADRLGVIDENGVFVDQLQTFALLCYYLLEYRGLRGPLVRSITSTRMIDRLGALYGVEVHETPVGFKYVGPKMTETGAIAAGEESGGYAFAGHIPERDGVYSGLLFLDLIARAGKKPSELVRELYAKVGQHYYDRVDVHLDPATRDAAIARAAQADPSEVAGVRVVSRDSLDGFRFDLGDKGWLLLRPSGTEPLLRIYTETTDKALVLPLLQAGKALAGV